MESLSVVDEIKDWADQPGPWQCWRFSRSAGVLILHRQNNDSSDGYLVLRGVDRVQASRAFRNATWTFEPQRVIAATAKGTQVFGCQSVVAYPGQPWGGIERDLGEWILGADAIVRLPESSRFFESLGGVQLFLETMFVSHSLMRLFVRGQSFAGELRFMGVDEIDLPVAVSNVRIKLASKGPGDDGITSTLHIDGDEGDRHYWLRAAQVAVFPRSSPDLEYQELLKRPLWNGGPELPDL